LGLWRLNPRPWWSADHPAAAPSCAIRRPAQARHSQTAPARSGDSKPGRSARRAGQGRLGLERYDGL